LDNESDLTYNCDARHLYKNTAILIKNKVLAGKNSNSKLSGLATIDAECEGCESDVAFVAMAEDGAKIDFMPGQRIKSEARQFINQPMPRYFICAGPACRGRKLTLH